MLGHELCCCHLPTSTQDPWGCECAKTWGLSPLSPPGGCGGARTGSQLLDRCPECWKGHLLRVRWAAVRALALLVPIPAFLLCHCPFLHLQARSRLALGRARLHQLSFGTCRALHNTPGPSAVDVPHLWDMLHPPGVVWAVLRSHLHLLQKWTSDTGVSCRGPPACGPSTVIVHVPSQHDCLVGGTLTQAAEPCFTGLITSIRSWYWCS